MAIRLQGILIYPLSLLVFAFLFFQTDEKPQQKKIIILTSIYFIMSIGALIFFFPALWINPIQEIFYGLQQLSRFPWPGGMVLYRGAMVEATNLPWHYVPVWVFITTPIIISLFFMIGLCFLFINFFKHPRIFIKQDFWYVIILLWLSVPVASILLIRSVLYDGWRHLFFIYPAYILLAVYGFKNIERIQFRRIKKNFRTYILYGIILIGLFPPVRFIYQNHPHEYVYFNRFAGRNYQEIKHKYEMDYWGLSYFDALKDLVLLNAQPQISVKFDNTPGKLNVKMLSPENADRITIKNDINQAELFMTNYRWHPQDYDMELFYAVSINDANISSIYRVTAEVNLND